MLKLILPAAIVLGSLVAAVLVAGAVKFGVDEAAPNAASPKGHAPCAALMENCEAIYQPESHWDRAVGIDLRQVELFGSYC